MSRVPLVYMSFCLHCVVLATTLGAWFGEESCTKLYGVDAFKGVYWGWGLIFRPWLGTWGS